MATINNYAVSLSLEASDYIRKSNLSRTATNQLRREIESARTPAERYELQVRRLEKAWQAGAIDARTYNRLLKEQKAALNGTRTASAGLLTKLGGMAAGYLSVRSAIGFMTDGIAAAAEAETNLLSFQALTKNADVAAGLLKSLKE